MDVTKPNDTIVNNLNNTTNVNTDTNKDENGSMKLRDDEGNVELLKKIKFKFIDKTKNEEKFDPVNQFHDEDYMYSSANRQFEKNNSRKATMHKTLYVNHCVI